MKKADIKTLAAIFWDFDGVLMNSNAVRDRGFEEVLKDYPGQEVARLMDFHRANGGLSRYVKFRYFFEEVRGEKITEAEIQIWANRFSKIMQQSLADPDLLIAETVDFVRRQSGKLPMYVVSGSDQQELRYLCEKVNIAQYFQRIHGSPTPKKDWVATLLREEDLTAAQCVLIGDSGNDRDAALVNGLQFMGYNNPGLEKQSTMNLTFAPQE